jgi:hypothetical protein
MSSELKSFTITMINGTRHGGKFANESKVRESFAHCLNKIQRIEQRPLWTPEEEAEMDADKAWHRAH